MTKQEQDVDIATVSHSEAGAPGNDGYVYSYKLHGIPRGLWVPAGLSGLEIVELSQIIREETDLPLYGAHALAIGLLKKLRLLRADGSTGPCP